MSTSKHTEAQSNHSRKSTRKEIGLQLASALNNLKETLGEKKFERRIKKAARLLTAGIKTKPVKKRRKEREKQRPTSPTKLKKP
ncbi:hypothetical protein [Paraflavitalea speifideaquila]|uniref:hypothetical protein n=1 Tax=Paraflavitalea speifideaquila TaxID=3076558 RepID=UPI0028E394EE|nr:hypothetical protein [Paraflavitalea speifideiaquila]